MTNFLLLPELIYEVVQSPLVEKNANSTSNIDYQQMILLGQKALPVYE